jgi:hypothetical protein
MSEAPEKIYIYESEDTFDVVWWEEQDKGEPVKDCIEYIRADKVSELRAALEAVEWAVTPTHQVLYCPWCTNAKVRGHAPDCQRQKALE